MATGKFCFYLQNRLIQTSQTGGQQYSDTSPFSIPCSNCHDKSSCFQHWANLAKDLLGSYALFDSLGQRGPSEFVQLVSRFSI
jgi:hypothetical protein